MTASVKPFHYQLNIYIADGTGGYIEDPVIRFGDHKGSLYIFYVQKFICRLSRRNGGGFPGSRIRIHVGKGEDTHIKLCIADALGTLLHGGKGAPEHLPYTGDIRTRLSEIGRGLKGPDARFILVIIRINQDTCVHGIRFHRLDLRLDGNVLEHFRNELAGRRSKGLDIGKGGILNGFVGLTVMVEDYHGIHHGEQLLTGRHTGPVHVADHKHGGLVHHSHCLLAADQYIRVALHILKAVYHRTDGFYIVVQNNIRLFLQGGHQPPDPHCRTEGVRIRPLMGHDQHLLLILQQFFKGLGLHSRLNTGILLGSGTLSAEIGYLIPVLHCCLIAAPAQSQTDGHLGILKALLKAVASRTDTDGNGHGDLIPHVDGLHLIQQRETVAPEDLHIFLRKYKEVFVILHPLYDGIDVGKIHVDLAVHQSRQGGMPDLVHGVHDLVIVVDICQTCDQLLVLIFLLQKPLSGHIKEIHNDDDVIILAFFLILPVKCPGQIHPADHGVILVIPVLHFHTGLPRKILE